MGAEAHNSQERTPMEFEIETAEKELLKALKGGPAEAVAGFEAIRKVRGSGKAELPTSLAPLIDHTLLKPDATPEQVKRLCAEAREHHFASVCVNGGYVPVAHAALADTKVKVCTVVGFPLGAMSIRAKARETEIAVSEGAQEIDMVLAVGRLKGQDFAHVYDDIRAVVMAASGRRVKVIIETALLDRKEKIQACLLAAAAHAHFVKTSTGFSGGGATVEDVELMKEVVHDALEVKASGGVRDAETAWKMVKAGATRLGTSSGIAIVQGTTGGATY
jgi:deoxyribose-phosphate aldolase